MAGDVKTYSSTAQDEDGILDLSGQKAEYAIRGNLNVSHEIQQDRLSIVPTQGAPAGQFRKMIQKAMQAAKQAVLQSPARRNGGTTLSMVMYDPETYTLEIGQAGDSPVFLLAEAGGRKYPIELTQHPSLNEHIADTIDGIGYSPMHAVDRTQKPIPQDGERGRKGNLDLAQLKKRLAGAFKVKSEEISLSLMVCSDGAVKAMPSEKLGLTELIAYPARGETNGLADLFDKLIENHASHDNLSGVVLRDLEPKKGSAFTVIQCDGHNYSGHDVAQAANKAATECIEQWKGRAYDMKLAAGHSSTPE